MKDSHGTYDGRKEEPPYNEEGVMDYCKKCGQHVTTTLTHDCSTRDLGDAPDELTRLRERVQLTEAELDATIVTGRKRESRLALLEKVLEAARAQVSKSNSVIMALKQYDAALRALREKEGKC